MRYKRIRAKIIELLSKNPQGLTLPDMRRLLDERSGVGRPPDREGRPTRKRRISNLVPEPVLPNGGDLNVNHQVNQPHTRHR